MANSNDTPKPPKKKIKMDTLISPSCAIQINNPNNNKLKEAMEALELTGYQSPLGHKLVINKLLETNAPFDLKAINQIVLEKDNKGYWDHPGMPKKGDDKEKDPLEEKDNKDNGGKENYDMKEEGPGTPHSHTAAEITNRKPA